MTSIWDVPQAVGLHCSWGAAQARQRNIPNLNQNNPVREEMGHPVSFLVQSNEKHKYEPVCSKVELECEDGVLGVLRGQLPVLGQDAGALRGLHVGILRQDGGRQGSARVANDSRPGRLIDSKIMVELKILLIILCHNQQSCCCGRMSQKWIGIDCCRQLIPKIWS